MAARMDLFLQCQLHLNRCDFLLNNFLLQCFIELTANMICPVLIVRFNKNVSPFGSIHRALNYVSLRSNGFQCVGERL